MTAPLHGLSGVQALILESCRRMPRGSAAVGRPTAGTPESVFGRLVCATPSNEQPREAQLRALADDMLEAGDVQQAGPADAGTAFLGQFIDHDLTLDVSRLIGQSAGDVTKIRNFRTPRLDLDCVYGGGPEVSPHLFEADGSLVFGRLDGEGNAPANHLDLPRARNGRALIGDPRNDENLFVSQVHGRHFIQAHNDAVQVHQDFEAAREATIHAYHARIRDEFLPQVVDAATLAPLMADFNRGFLSRVGEINWDDAPDMPVEFSGAAFRFGHSMIRQTYTLNDDFKKVAIFDGTPKLTPFAAVLADHNLALDKFFGSSAQKSRPIDTRLPKALFELPAEIVGTGERNLAFRNMQRGQLMFDLPSGERMATLMGFTPLPPHELITKHGLDGKTPLWFYILAEAETLGGKLGPVGGTLVAGVLLNLMLRDICRCD